MAWLPDRVKKDAGMNFHVWFDNAAVFLTRSAGDCLLDRVCDAKLSVSFHIVSSSQARAAAIIHPV